MGLAVGAAQAAKNVKRRMRQKSLAYINDGMSFLWRVFTYRLRLLRRPSAPPRNDM